MDVIDQQQIVREFFTDSEWDLIFDLLDSNRQFDDSEDYHEDYLTAIQKIRSLFSWLIMTLSADQLRQLKVTYCEHIVDSMDVKDLMMLCHDLLMDQYQELTEDEMQCEVEELYSEDMWEELMEGVQNWCWIL